MEKRHNLALTFSLVGPLSCHLLLLIMLLVIPLILAVASSAICATKGGKAEERITPDKVVRLSDLIKEAKEKNMGLRAAKLKWESIKEKYPRATSYDDPMVTYVQPIREIETRLGPQERIITLSQKIPFPGKLGLKGDIVTKEIEIAKTEYQKATRDLTTEVKKAYYELYYVDKVMELSKENDAVLDYFAEVSRTNYGLSVSQLDELVRAQKLSARASFDLIRSNDIRSNIVARLNALLYRPQDYPVGKAEEPELKTFQYHLNELLIWGVENYEELKIAGLKVKKGDLEKDLSRYSYLPNFRIGVNYSQIGDPPSLIPDAGEDAYAVTFGMNIPLWFSKNKAAVSQASINREKSFIEKNAITNELENKIKRVYFNLTNSERIVKLYGETLIPEAKDSLAFAEARYKSGEEMLGRLLETQSMWINFQLVYFRSLTDYFKSIAELERLTAKKLY